MSWFVYNSNGKLLQSLVISDNSVTNAKMADDAIDSAEIANGAIDTAHIAGSQITNALMADDAIGVAELSATGTASSGTFLRGDNAWAAATGTAPVFGRVVRTAGSVTTTSTSLVDFTGDTITLTTGAFPVVYGVAFMVMNSVATATYVNVDIDGTLQQGSSGFRINADTSAFDMNLSITGQSVALSAASHTFKVKWMTSSETATAKATSTFSHQFWVHEIR